VSLEDRKKQGRSLLTWLWTGLTGTPEQIRELGDEVLEDARRQVEERRTRRVLNEGHRVEIEPPPAERRRP
jgi:hypothetical protein